eukprot:scaffold1355_cov268-Pinguiococcus_pyrenoidosus.AAC.13
MNAKTRIRTARVFGIAKELLLATEVAYVPNGGRRTGPLAFLPFLPILPRALAQACDPREASHPQPSDVPFRETDVMSSSACL